MFLRAVVASVVCGIVLSATALAQSIRLRPGRYETLTVIDMPNSPMKLPPQKDVECITAEDLRDLSKKLLDDGDQDCKVANHRQTADRLQFSAACVAGGQSYTVSMDVTFTPDSFSGQITSDNKEYPMTASTSGKRIGDCTK